jgi:pimeloyl-ACP methyl ester carboxylesterase
MPTFDRDGIQFYYEVRGEGRALVLTHGLTGNLEHMKELIADTPGYRQIFWDQRGHGRTNPVGPAAGFRFETFAEDLAALLAHLGVRECVAAGVSMGAAVSVRYAIRYPERACALILIRPAWLIEPLPEGLRLFPRVAELLERYGPDGGCRRLEALPEYLALRARFPDAADALRAQFSETQALERSLRITGIPNDAPLRDWNEVAQLAMPALVIGNEPDYVHPRSYATTWAERLPNGRYVEVPAKLAGFEPYARAVRHALGEFLQSIEDN